MSAAKPPSADDAGPAVFFKPKKSQLNTRKRSKPDEAAEDEPKVEVVKAADLDAPKKSSVTTFTTQKAALNLTDEFSFKASGTAAPLGDQKTFSYNLIDNDVPEAKAHAPIILNDPDEAQQMIAKQQKLKDDAPSDPNVKIYKGMNNYDKYIEVKPTNIKIGPVKSSLNVRYSVRFDYQPDVCKDYKETGYCGFGDSCKFMHDRGDYKSGWQLDKEWDEQQKSGSKKAAKEVQEEEEKEESEFPFACWICRKEFTDPVVTKCGHYFCESCVLSHHRKSKKCPVCDQATGGVFNRAAKLITHLSMKEREKQKQDALEGIPPSE